MRYIAKIHVLDLMDKVVVSGYIYDADPLTDPDHESHEFTLETAGMGLSDPMTWLQVHLYQAFHKETTRLAGEGARRAAVGASHTISESGETDQKRLG